MLFKVKTTSVASVMFDGSFRVKWVCFDPNILESFLINAKESTPLKSVSGAITIDETDEDEDHDVGEKTQTEDFVSGITGCSRNVSPLASEFDDTTNVDEVDECGDGEASIGDVAKDGGLSVAVENVKRNLNEAFDEAFADVGGLPRKAVKIENH